MEFAKTIKNHKVLAINVFVFVVALEYWIAIFGFAGILKLTCVAAKIFLWVTLSFILACIASYSYMNFTRKAKLINQFPHPEKLPLVGNLFDFYCKPEEVIKRVSNYKKKYGRYFSFWVGHSPHVVVMNGEIAQKILSSSKILQKGDGYDGLKWLLGEGLITAKVNIWQNDRKVLNPAFKYNMLGGFLSSFNKHSRTLIQIMENNFQNLPKGGNLFPLLCGFTIDTITESALGKSFNVQWNTECEFIEIVKLALETFRTSTFQPWLMLPIIRNISGVAKDKKKVLEFFGTVFNSVIEERKEALRNKCSTNESEMAPFIDLLLNFESDAHIMAHTITIFCAGFETTANTINYTLFLLALYPHCQQKVYEELEKIFENDLERDVQFTDLAQMKLMELCIKESLRLYPTAPLIVRVPQEDIPLGDGKCIPKGCNVTIIIKELHRDESVFSDPHKFIPERFNSKSLGQYAYMPFSAGPRSCIGQKYAMLQMKTALSYILRRFEISTSTKEADLKLVFGMVLELAQPIKLHLKNRMIKL